MSGYIVVTNDAPIMRAADGESMFWVPDSVYDAGYGHLFIGYKAGAAYQAGESSRSNVAIGPYAGMNLHGGGVLNEGNVFLGYNAGLETTEGTHNTYLGDATGSGCVTAQNQVYVGYHCGLNSKGEANIAMGYQALRGHLTDSTGGHNIAIGQDTLVNLTTGKTNVCVGPSVARSLTSGSLNTLYGYNVGDNLTTGSRNILIGHELEAPSSSTSDYLNIGGALKGDMSSGLYEIDGSLSVKSLTVADLPAPSAAHQGRFVIVTDSSVTTFGAIVAGGGNSKVFTWCNGSNWTVMGI